MRIVSSDVDSTVASTTSGDRLVVHAWRGGQVLAADLDVTAFSFRWSAAQQIQGQASFTIADPDGKLAPISPDDTLGWGGSRLQVSYVWGDSRVPPVPLGWWRIRKPDPAETWRFYRPGGSAPRYGWGEGPWGAFPWGGDTSPQAETIDEVPVGALLVHSGGEVKVDADEEYSSVVMARLDAEPVTTATSLAEVARLLRDVGISITVTGGVIDRDVPAGLVYDESRMDAVEDHLDRVQAAHRMTGDGSIEIVPVAGVGPVWKIGGGDAGVLIDVNRASSDDGFYNQVISRGETEDGQQLRGYAELPAEHPLSPRGPMGPVPMFHRSPAKTADGVQADADTLLWNRTDSGEVSVHVTCLLHPGLQLHDLVNLNMPTRAGEQQIPGRVVAMAFGSTSGTPSKSMEIELKVSSDLLMAVAWRVRYGA